MGHSHGKFNVKKKSFHKSAKTKAFDPNSPAPELSEEEVQMIKDMWAKLNTAIAKVGAVEFVDLFDTHPEVQDVFMSFRTRSASDLEYNQIIRRHALRVMGIVEKCVNRLDKREKLRDLMTELGEKHLNYSVKIEYIDLMGPQFISSIKPHLEDIWTEEHKLAWENLFQLMCYYMKKAMCSI